MKNLIQFAPIFAAAGCELNFNSALNELSVITITDGKGKRGKLDGIVTNALEEISHYLDTANYQDGLAALAICQWIDTNPNPLPEATRQAILTGLGIMREGKYIAQNLALQKVNRSWHTSEKAGECTYFGEICTHRGIREVPGKRGRKATREPNEYHRTSQTGIISREQLVTPSLEALYDTISPDRLIAIEKPKVINVEKLLRNIGPEKLAEIIELKEKELALLKEHGNDNEHNED